MDFWIEMLVATNARCVVDLAAGSGVTARACLHQGIPWVGLCWNAPHAQWLSNVLDRWVVAEIVDQESVLFDRDMAKQLLEHFPDHIQHIEDVDGDEEDVSKFALQGEVIDVDDEQDEENGNVESN